MDEDGEDGDGDGDVAPLDGIRTWNTAAGTTEDGGVIFGEAVNLKAGCYGVKAVADGGIPSEGPGVNAAEKVGGHSGHYSTSPQHFRSLTLQHVENDPPT